MDRKVLGNSDLCISQLGLGSWAIGGDIGQWGWGAQDEQQSINTIHTALDAGINWIDTAPAYGLGNAERVVNKALKQSTHKPLIFSKCGFRWRQDNGELCLDLSKQFIAEEVENSLTRLGVECIDLYQIHRPGSDLQNQQAWHVLCDLKKQGKVRHIGVSNFSSKQMQLLSEIAPITSNQPSYSLLNRDIEAIDLPYCKKNNIGTIHHSTMANGLLSGSMSHKRFATLDKNDWRFKSHHFKEPNFSHNLQLVSFLKELADQKNCTVAQLSIAWTLSHPATTASIIGARSADQLSGLLPATHVTLSQEELFVINQYSQKLQNETI